MEVLHSAPSSSSFIELLQLKLVLKTSAKGSREDSGEDNEEANFEDAFEAGGRTCSLRESPVLLTTIYPPHPLPRVGSHVAS